MRSRIVYRCVGAPECCSYLVCKQSVKRDGVWRWEKRVLILCAEEMTSQEPPTCPLVNNAEAQRGKEQEQHWLTWLDLSAKKPNIRHLEGQTNGMWRYKLASSSEPAFWIDLPMEGSCSARCIPCNLYLWLALRKTYQPKRLLKPLLGIFIGSNDMPADRIVQPDG